MSWWTDFADQIEHDVPIAPLTWFRLGGPARFLFHPDSGSSLAFLNERARHENLPVRVLGGGANVLVRDDGVDGVVVRLDQPAFRAVEWLSYGVRVGAGVDLMPLVKECCRRGLSGMEGLAGIPGTIGGAVRMNAGGRFGEIGDVVREVDVLLTDGTRETWNSERVGFAYRRTSLGDAVVLGAHIELTPDDPNRVRQRFEEILATKKNSQPLADNSAGCIFKNPPGQSAGALIDQAALKGFRCGMASVSEEHANFIVVQDGAKTSDVLRLIGTVRCRVQEKFGTQLEVEVDIW